MISGMSLRRHYFRLHASRQAAAGDAPCHEPARFVIGHYALRLRRLSFAEAHLPSTRR